MATLHINGKKHSVEAAPEIPEINVEIAHYYKLPNGVGEPGVPTIVNAIFRATCKQYNPLLLSDFNLAKI